jgi:hypothetical protein
MHVYSSGLRSSAVFALADTQLDTIVPTSAGLIERGIKILRVGTFTDSKGRVRTYTPESLEAAAQNFRHLRSSNVLPNVPVKIDHSISMRDVIGYFLDVRFEAPFLVADVEFTTAKSAEDYRTGHLRNRSIEIGEYVTNEGQSYDPVAVGLAFVDLPAVEGLYRLSEGEPNMSGNATSTQTPPAATDAPTTDPPVTTPPSTDPPAADPPATDPPAADPPAADPPATDPPADPAGTAQHQRPAGQVHTFRLFGQEVQDFGRVQDHISALEKFRSDSITAERAAFMKSLTDRKIMTNPQVTDLKPLVDSFDEAQFAAFKKTYDEAGPASIFARHDTNGSTDPNADPNVLSEIEQQEEIVANLRRTGKDETFIEKTAAFRRLTELRAQK